MLRKEFLTEQSGFFQYTILGSGGGVAKVCIYEFVNIFIKMHFQERRVIIFPKKIHSFCESSHRPNWVPRPLVIEVPTITQVSLAAAASPDKG